MGLYVKKCFKHAYKLFMILTDSLHIVHTSSLFNRNWGLTHEHIGEIIYDS